MVVTFLGLQKVDFTPDQGQPIDGTNFWYHFDRAYSDSWSGFQVVKKFIRANDPILPKLRSLVPGKKVDVEFMALGKTSVLVDVKPV